MGGGHQHPEPPCFLPTFPLYLNYLFLQEPRSGRVICGLKWSIINTIFLNFLFRWSCFILNTAKHLHITLNRLILSFSIELVSSVLYQTDCWNCSVPQFFCTCTIENFWSCIVSPSPICCAGIETLGIRPAMPKGDT